MGVLIDNFHDWKRYKLIDIIFITHLNENR